MNVTVPSTGIGSCGTRLVVLVLTGLTPCVVHVEPQRAHHNTATTHIVHVISCAVAQCRMRPRNGSYRGETAHRRRGVGAGDRQWC